MMGQHPSVMSSGARYNINQLDSYHKINLIKNDYEIN